MTGWAEAVTKKRADLGILICGTGVGMSIAANKRHGIRAVCCSEAYSAKMTSDEWFAAVKEIAERHGYTTDMKAYKADPSAFKGSVADVSTVIRVAVTGKRNSPDLCEVMAILGEDRSRARLECAKA